MRAKKILWGIIVCLAVFTIVLQIVIGNILPGYAKNIFVRIHTICFFLLPIFVYILVLIYDSSEKKLLRSIILNYILILSSAGIFLYYMFFDPWAGVFFVYTLLAALFNLIVITIVNYKILIEYNISLRKEWIIFIVYSIVLFLFFLFPK